MSDPTLIGLIRQSIAGNLELKILAQEIEIAQNEVLLWRGSYLPFVTFGANAGVDRHSRFTLNGAVEEQLEYLPGRRFPTPLPNFLMATNVSWQLDIWRKLRNARDAAALRYLGTAEGRNYAITRLVSEVAQAYYELMALDQRLETIQQNIKLQEQSLEIALLKKEAGRGNELAVQRFQAEVLKNQSERPIVQQEILEVENRINFLLGRFPQSVERTTTGFLDLNLHGLSVGVPSQLLLNRPDVRQAEKELAAAGLDIAVARADFFPQINLTAGVGYQAFNPRYLFDPEALVANAAGDLVAPLINKSAIKAAYQTANARQLQAVYNYQRVVLEAYTEVVNRINRAENCRNSVELKRRQLTALVNSVEISTQLFQNARVEYIEVLFAQRDLLDARLDLIDTKKNQLTAIIAAYQALGGGFPTDLESNCPPPTLPVAPKSTPVTAAADIAPKISMPAIDIASPR